MAKRGRPAFKPTAAQRRMVANGAGGGMNQDAIATALGISIDTLQKYFARELYEVASKKRLEVLDALARQGARGNVSAAKAYLAMTGPLAIAPPAGASKPEGKKAQANEDAKTAQVGSGWADLLPGNVTPLRKPGG